MKKVLLWPSYVPLNITAPKHAFNDNCQQPIICLNKHLACYIMTMHHVVATLLIKPPIILRKGSPNTLKSCRTRMPSLSSSLRHRQALKLAVLPLWYRELEALCVSRKLSHACVVLNMDAIKNGRSCCRSTHHSIVIPCLTRNYF
jgi:hypothetical protein